MEKNCYFEKIFLIYLEDSFFSLHHGVISKDLSYNNIFYFKTLYVSTNAKNLVGNAIEKAIKAANSPLLHSLSKNFNSCMFSICFK